MNSATNDNRRAAGARGLLLTLGLVVYHASVTIPHLNGRLLTTFNVILGVALTIAALTILRIPADELGLGVRQLKGLAVGVGLAVVLATPFALAVAIRSTAPVLRDARYHYLPASTLIYILAFQLPIQTVVVEELIFRGVLFAVTRPLGRGISIIGTSLAFGLWHVGPAIALARAHSERLTLSVIVLGTLLAFVTTTLGGIVLTWLRLRYRGLQAPIGFHWTVNATAILISHAAWYR